MDHRWLKLTGSCLTQGNLAGRPRARTQCMGRYADWSFLGEGGQVGSTVDCRSVGYLRKHFDLGQQKHLHLHRDSYCMS